MSATEPGTPNSLYLGIGGASPEFMVVGDEESISNCPLLTPSPTNHFHHPLAYSSSPSLGYERQQSPSSEDTEISTIPTSLANAGPTDKPSDTNDRLLEAEGSSASSSCSAIQDSTASAQLLNYLTLTDPSSQEKGGTHSSVTLLGLSKSAAEYGFVSWNWSLIRLCCFWGAMSLTVACICVIIAYMATIPNHCDPPRAWHQGSLIYQVFPPSFQDTDNNGVGDLKGITSRIAYFQKLGVRSVRLSYIFPATGYPEYYDKVINLTQIDPSLGNFDDFRVLVETLHTKNISVIIDLPIYPYFSELKVRNNELEESDKEKHFIINNHILVSPLNKSHNYGERGEITDIMTFWLNIGVDGFYLLGLENFVDDDKFISQVLEWRSELDIYSQVFNKVLICSEKVLIHIQMLEIADVKNRMRTVMKSFDLVNVRIDPFIYGTDSIKSKIMDIQAGVVYSKPGYPWIYWTCGDMYSHRLASKSPYGNGTLATILTVMSLPGTPGLFYGDERGLQDISDPNKERSDLEHAHHLGPMHWSEMRRTGGFSNNAHVIPWLPYSYAKLPKSSADIIAAMSSIRESNPGIYMHAIMKNGKIVPNTFIRYLDLRLITIERTYPRRHSFLLIANLGESTVKKDLSKHYYAGNIILNTYGTNDYVTFHNIELVPGQVIVAKLDK